MYDVHCNGLTLSGALGSSLKSEFISQQQSFPYCDIQHCVYCTTWHSLDVQTVQI